MVHSDRATGDIGYLISPPIPKGKTIFLIKVRGSRVLWLPQKACIYWGGISMPVRLLAELDGEKCKAYNISFESTQYAVFSSRDRNRIIPKTFSESIVIF
jgi:hypothetical protein